MQLQDLAAFLAVADDRSFSSARQAAPPHAAGHQPGGPANRGRAGGAAVRPLVARRHADGSRTPAAGIRAAAARARGRSGGRGPGAPAGPARPRDSWRQRGRRAQPAAVCRAVCGAASRGRRRGPARSVTADGAKRCWSLARLRRAHVPAGRSRHADDAARRRRARPAHLAATSARHSTEGLDRGGRASGRHRPQRSVADPRARAPRVRATPHVHQYPDLAARASTASSARSKWGSAWRCSRADAR